MKVIRNIDVQSKEKLFKNLLDHKKSIFNICLGFCKDYGNAEDLCQDIYVKLWEKLDQIKAHKNPKAWLYLTARNICVDHIRREKRFQQLIRLKKPQKTEKSPETYLLLTEKHRAIKQLIAKLPLKMRIVFILREYGDWSYQEIAETLNVQIGTVHSRMNRAKGVLIKHLKELYHE